MNYYIGIDLGTSSCKGILTDNKGNIVAQSNNAYPVLYPNDGWTEQNPEDWLCACQKVLKELSFGRESNVKGISFGGQMHGLVVLDANDNVIRPCILWNDGRTEQQTAFLNGNVGKTRLSTLTGNIAFAGFTAPKILWIKENEPNNFKRIAKIMLPKDYLAYKLTGVFSTDYSDASGTLLLDVKNKCWSAEMCEICGVRQRWLPKLYESYEVVGKILPKYGLPNAVVCAGAGDNAAAAIGTGCVHNGDCNISLGTSGTVFVCQNNFFVDKNNALHSFAHANGKWHLMGCILSAASARKWWLEEILGSANYNSNEQEIANATDSDVIFLPYLSGERSPHNDVNAKGAFVGLTAITTRAQMSKAVMEGVAFALKDCIEVAKCNGVNVDKITICGGGAKSNIWKQIVANVLNVEVVALQTEQGPSYGAAILAMVGAQEYKTIEEATSHLIRRKASFLPNASQVAFYKTKYEKFTKLYPVLKDIFNKQQI